MKNRKHYIYLLIIGLLSHLIQAQTVNWQSLKENEKHILNVNTGAEYGIIYGIAYGYKLNSGLFPIIANAEFSIPSGEKLLDDFKSKIGGNIRWVKLGKFQFSTKAQSVFRRFGNENVRLSNFGMDVSGILGYYENRWFAGAEAGFDKAIVTHFKHTDKYRETFPGVKDGWYEPATGGNFYYAVQGGYTFKNQEIYLKLGSIVSQDFKTKPLLPYLLQIGYNYKL
ncbi:hypothetical protein [Flavobacterium lindanitolerans]|uniref:Outer membrane protein with beta-barrel domain n=1 Tax=Flavobacterium lindanitolerans TaxID=428988 RepID=A0A497V9H4_9FLAO|nr:hypothetical protein [Flavobacterium lindanitolerans]PKW29630.1 hypothetical protein B0G92_1273 [Flavobacterium lindanitolerans]RLJ34869.1 hypothetical protein CLV50_0231 [Flavobacterium lindanitolerans]